jgi:sec-independent protein translocase protein TatC
VSDVAPPPAGPLRPLDSGMPGEPPPPRPAPPFAEPAPRATGEMSFLEHLEDLRKVLMRSLLACAVGAIGGWWLAPRVLEDAIRRTVRHVIVLAPLEAFNERLKLTLVLGLCIALPVVFVQLWSFIVPALFRRERRLILPMAMLSMALFALGAAASYFYVTPLVVRVLGGFMTPSMEAQIRVGALLSFFYNLALACGVVFQLPLVTMTLTALGLVTPGFLLKQWRYAIVLVFVVTAAITPGDVVTAQLIMGLPMIALYLLSVGLAAVVARRRAVPAPLDEGGRGA